MSEHLAAPQPCAYQSVRVIVEGVVHVLPLAFLFVVLTLEVWIGDVRAGLYQQEGRVAHRPVDYRPHEMIEPSFFFLTTQ